MTNTTHYNMTIAEGADIVNPLTQIFPNFNTIDDAMFANKQSGIGTATEVTTGPVHAIVRANTDSNVFRFTATSAWTAGDTMTLDGNAVIVHMSDGTVPATGAYIIGAEVLAMVNSGLVTLAISSNGGVTSFNTRTGNVMPEASDYNASDIDFDNTNTTLTSTDVQGAIEEIAAEMDRGHISVEATNNSTTWKNMLDSLFSLIDNSKISCKTTVQIDDTDNGHRIYNMIKWYANYQYLFSQANGAGSIGTFNEIINVQENTSSFVRYIYSGAYSDYTSQNCPEGTKIYIYY